MNCYDQGFLSRILATLIFLSFIRKFTSLHYLILPFFLTYLDMIEQDICRIEGPYATRTFSYQVREKLGDVVSYLLIYSIVPVDRDVIAYILFRLIGVLLFGMTRNDRWLIVFPDMFKEYLLYHLIFRGEMSGFSLLIPVKMVFERWNLTANVSTDPVRHIVRKARQELFKPNSTTQAPPANLHLSQE